MPIFYFVRQSLMSTSDVSATTPRLSQAKSVKNTGSIPTSDLSPAIADPTNNTKAFTFRNVDGVETDDSLTPPSSTPRESHQSEQVSELKVDV